MNTTLLENQYYGVTRGHQLKATYGQEQASQIKYTICNMDH